MKFTLILILPFSLLSSASAQVSGFRDGAHHRYDINDEDKIIAPLAGQRQYPQSQVRDFADNILYQKSNGADRSTTRYGPRHHVGKMKKMGILCEIHQIADLLHTFRLFKPWFGRTGEDIVEFLNNLLTGK